MTRLQRLTLSSLGIKWRIVRPGRYRLFFAGAEREVTSYDEALDFAALCYRSL